jgi:hypothetical protein
MFAIADSNYMLAFIILQSTKIQDFRVSEFRNFVKVSELRNVSYTAFPEVTWNGQNGHTSCKLGLGGNKT